jgi:hypothetical protein
MRRFQILLVLMVFLAMGCSKSQRSSSDEAAGIAETGGMISYLAAPPAPPPRESHAKSLSTESKIIQTAQLEFQVNNLEKSKKRIGQLVNVEKGYISNLEEDNDRTRIQTSFTIRVPAGGFDRLVENILKEGIYVGSAKIERKDVTEEFLDLKARMETQKALESRYREILRQAKSVEDILKVEEALGKLREEIEAKEGRMNFLAHQAEYSTINARVYQTLPYSPPPKSSGQGFIGRITTSLVDGWTALIDFTIGLFSIWPALIALGVILSSIVRWRKRRTRRGIDKKDSAVSQKT